MNEIENNLKTWIPGIFGENDCKLAIHPRDKERALYVINYAFFKNVAYERFIELCVQYLYSRGCDDTHIAEQIKRIDKSKFSSYNITASKCWLISIEKSIDLNNFSGQKTLSSKNIINIISHKKSSETIIDYINFYASSTLFSITQKLSYPQINKKSASTMFAKLYKSDKGFSFDGLVIFERIESYIVGRQVKILKHEKMEDNEIVIFDDHTLTDINKVINKHYSS